MEFYWSYVDYEVLMKFTEKMLSHLIKTIKGKLKFTFNGKTVDFKTPLPRLTFRDAILNKVNIDIDQIKTETEFKQVLKQHNLRLDLTGVDGLGCLFYFFTRNIFVLIWKDQLFLTNYRLK